MDDTLRKRLAYAYGAATAVRWPYDASIHVGQDVWDAMRSTLPDGAALGVVSTLWGYPMALEADFDPDRIEVRAVQVIL